MVESVADESDKKVSDFFFYLQVIQAEIHSQIKNDLSCYNLSENDDITLEI